MLNFVKRNIDNFYKPLLYKVILSRNKKILEWFLKNYDSEIQKVKKVDFEESLPLNYKELLGIFNYEKIFNKEVNYKWFIFKDFHIPLQETKFWSILDTGENSLTPFTLSYTDLKTYLIYINESNDFEEVVIEYDDIYKIYSLKTPVFLKKKNKIVGLKTKTTCFVFSEFDFFKKKLSPYLSIDFVNCHPLTKILFYKGGYFVNYGLKNWKVFTIFYIFAFLDGIIQDIYYLSDKKLIPEILYQFYSVQLHMIRMSVATIRNYLFDVETSKFK